MTRLNSPNSAAAGLVADPDQTAPLVVDTLAVVVAFLRDDPEVTALLGGRVSTVPPPGKVFPLARVTRVGGAPAFGFSVWLDQALFQIDVWADDQTSVSDTARCCVEALAERLPGSRPGGVVTATRITSVATDIDPEYEPVKHRARLGATVTAHP